MNTNEKPIIRGMIYGEEIFADNLHDLKCQAAQIASRHSNRLDRLEVVYKGETTTMYRLNRTVNGEVRHGLFV